MLSQFYHNYDPTDKYYAVIHFFEELGLQSEENLRVIDRSEHLFSLPGYKTVGRVYQTGNQITVQFFAYIEKISKSLKFHSFQVIQPLRAEYFFGLLLIEFLKIPIDQVSIRRDGYAIDLSAKGGQN